jgi:hypothetical protein
LNDRIAEKCGPFIVLKLCLCKRTYLNQKLNLAQFEILCADHSPAPVESSVPTSGRRSKRKRTHNQVGQADAPLHERARNPAPHIFARPNTNTVSTDEQKRRNTAHLAQLRLGKKCGVNSVESKVNCARSRILHRSVISNPRTVKKSYRYTTTELFEFVRRRQPDIL